MSPDSTCYLDIAGGYLRHGLDQPVNAFWSPLFSWLLAAALAIFRPAPQNESTLLHALNFAGFLAALRSFEYFFRLLLRAGAAVLPESPQEYSLAELFFWALGYGVFLSTSFFILEIPSDTPDVWVCVLTYLAAGLLLSIHLRVASWLSFVAFGFVLALAYLAKSVYFPLSFVFLLAAWAAAGFSRKSLKFVAAALLTFLLLAGSWVLLLSRSEGHMTFGDAGRINFAIFYARLPQAHFWQGEDSTGTPLHPVRLLSSQPRLFEFASPREGTYPPILYWSYWESGLRVRFNVSGFLATLRQSLGTFFLLLIAQAEFAVALFLLFFLARPASEFLSFARVISFLWAPPLVACLSYALVLVEGRYVAPFVVILWAVALLALSAAARAPRRLFVALVLAVLCVTGLRFVKLAQSDLFAIAAHPRNLDAEVALALRRLGLLPGDRIASLGAPTETHWARQAGLSIVAEIPKGDENIFWMSAPEKKQELFQLLAGSGAKFLVAPEPALVAAREGWIPLGATGFSAYRLPSAAKPGAPR